jgi:hypothetical protein
VRQTMGRCGGEETHDEDDEVMKKKHTVTRGGDSTIKRRGRTILTRGDPC